mmetsp:Transcript_4473/g.12895  ORF Transcript_4473/g.12895 Transcript_4473/m.12895 type:complete len:139 (+) Transcript_4473:187-603(+)
MAAPVQYMEGKSLIQTLASVEGTKPLVIDVRGPDEVAAGHIGGAINIPSDSFDDDDEVDAIIAKHLDAAQEVVVHCALSQVRGPRCANRLASRLAAADKPAKVVVLRGGYNGFLEEFGINQPELFANLDYAELGNGSK